MPLPESLLGRTWETTAGVVTSKDLLRVYNAVERGYAPSTGIPGAAGNSDRRVDRATKLLRRAGLIEFAGGKWRVNVKREVV